MTIPAAYPPTPLALSVATKSAGADVGSANLEGAERIGGTQTALLLSIGLVGLAAKRRR